jgi:hypothetical protein
MAPKSSAGVVSALVLCASIASCRATEQSGEALAVETRDSAGVILIRNGLPDGILTLNEQLRVGVAGGNPDLEFNQIRALAVDSTGGFWVVDSSPSVRYYGDAGQYLGSVGGAGQGPGEAAGYARVWLGKGVVLLRGFPAVLQSFESDGTFLTSLRSRTTDGALLTPLGFSDSTWVLQLGRFDAGATAPSRTLLSVVAGSTLAEPFDTVHSFLGELTVRTAEGGFARASAFHGNPSIGVDSRGNLFVSDTLTYRIDVYKLGGGLARRIQRPTQPRDFEPAWISEVERGVREAFSQTVLNGRPLTSSDEPQVAAAVKAALPVAEPAQLPVILSMLIASDGSAWIERGDLHPRPAMRAVAHSFGYVRHAWLPEWLAPQVFDLLTPDGEYRGTVNLPAEYVPMAVTANEVYGVLYDDLGVERIVRYGIQR